MNAVYKKGGRPRHYELEWEFWLGFCLGGNTTHTHDFFIPLDFLGIKDLMKNKQVQCSAKIMYVSSIPPKQKPSQNSHFGS